MISRLIPPEHGEVIQEGMVFALETYWPAPDGWQAARIEEQLIVTKTGCEVITRFPAEELLVAGQRYQTVTGPLPTMREHQSNLNRRDGSPGPAPAKPESATPQPAVAAARSMHPNPDDVR